MGLVMRTSGPDVNFKSTRGGAGEMCPWYGSIRVLFIYFMSIYVSCWKETHVFEGSIVFSSLFRVFSLSFVVRGYFCHERSKEGGISVYLLFYVNNPDCGTLFIGPTTSQHSYEILEVNFELSHIFHSSSSSFHKLKNLKTLKWV